VAIGGGINIGLGWRKYRGGGENLQKVAKTVNQVVKKIKFIGERRRQGYPCMQNVWGRGAARGAVWKG
jgi:hypothetical protein